MSARLRTVILAGIVGAVCIDLYLVFTEGFIFRDATAITVSQWDASNLLGLSAFDGGIATAVIGLCMHLLVSTTWAAVYVYATVRMPLLRAHPFVGGLCFGAIVMAIMLFVVVPIGRAPMGPTDAWGWLNRSIAHTLFFGVPVALTTGNVRAQAKLGL